MNQQSNLETHIASHLTGIQRLSHFIRRHWVMSIVAGIIIIIIFIKIFAPGIMKFGKGKSLDNNQRPQPVTAVETVKADLDVYLRALGTVTPTNTVTVKSQVGGQLMNLHFKEGQMVNKGDLLAEIDPRPFEVQLMQAQGQLARDESLLKNAQVDLERYKLLWKQDSIAEQQVVTQAALVEQLKGAVETDKGQVANAKLQLTYSRVIAPLSGRVGLRQVDPGNMVAVTDPNGLVVITQLQPITVVFSLPQDNLPAVLKRFHTGTAPVVLAYNQEGSTLLAQGRLIAVDNQIDTTTGTVKLKASFDNKDNKLFPNQFVNIRLKVDTLRGATVMSAAAVQRGSIGTFAYVVKPDKMVTVKQLKLGPTEGDKVAVTEGLMPGEMVVTVGGDKLREGSEVEMMTPDGKPATAPAAGTTEQKTKGKAQKKMPQAKP